MKKSIIKKIIKDTIPVMTGYMCLGFGFGILLEENGFNTLWSLAMSTFIYAGSMQFVAVPLLVSEASLLTVFLTTLLVNARHLFYGIAILETYKDTHKTKPYLIFALTDETFSLLSRENIQENIPYNISKEKYFFLISLFNHSYWILGSILGSLAGMIIPISFKGIEFVLTALFVTILIDNLKVKNNVLPSFIGLVSTSLCLLIFNKDIFLIPSMIIILLLVLLLYKKNRGEAK